MSKQRRIENVTYLRPLLILAKWCLLSGLDGNLSVFLAPSSLLYTSLIPIFQWHFSKEWLNKFFIFLL